MRRSAVLARALGIACLVALAGHAQAQGHAHRGPADHRFDDAERWARIFDDPARDAWQQPDAVIRALKLPPDAIVADIGAGTGYFAVRLARAVPAGRVVGVDASADMVRYLGERAKREGLANLVAQRGGADDPRLAAPVDVALLVDVYHHILAPERYFERLRGSLKPGGRVAVIDFRMDSRRGPPPSGRVAPDQVRAELGRAGFELVEEHAFLPDQYYLVFRPAAQ
jgi:SAM-dependent methyltransferase